jgi:hypothetical protein
LLVRTQLWFYQLKVASIAIKLHVSPYLVAIVGPYYYLLREIALLYPVKINFYKNSLRLWFNQSHWQLHKYSKNLQGQNCTTRSFITNYVMTNKSKRQDISLDYLSRMRQKRNTYKVQIEKQKPNREFWKPSRNWKNPLCYILQIWGGRL